MSVTAGRMLLRDWRGGELGVLLAALVLAVAVVVGISAFTSRLQSALEQESHRFLAADLVLASGAETGTELRRRGEEAGLATARVLNFSSMVFAEGDAMQLVSVKAVSDNYPLRGTLRYSGEAFAPLLAASAGPAPGEVWLDSRLFPLLEVAVGDRVQIGDADFTVAAAAGTEPDQGGSFLGFGPRVLMNYRDIPATGIVQPGSRVEYRELFAGGSKAVAAYRQWLEPRLEPGQRLTGIGEAQPGIGRALERAERFLLLAGSLGVVLAGVAIALAARRFSERHRDFVAIMKSLGATSAAVNGLYARSLVGLGLLASLLGCGGGWVLQSLFFDLFARELPVQPGATGPRPYLIGGTTALVCLLCFAWPPLGRLGRVSPLRVLRRDLPDEARRGLVDYLLGLAAISLLMWWYSRDWKLTLAVLAGLAVTAVFGLGLALTLLRGGRLVGMSAGSIWRLALAGLQRRGVANALQVVIFGMAIMLLLVMVLLRTSLVEHWQAQLPEHTPNHFMLNIAPEQVQAVEHLLRENRVASEAFYPMIRGRIMAVNDEPLPEGEQGGNGRRQRESNLTWSETLPDDNRLVEGEWWPPDATGAWVSVELEYAERMGIGVGDRLAFLVGSEPLEATVTSLRELDWQSFKPNFFLVFPPRLLATYPATFMTSFHLEPERKTFLNEFIRRFPTVTLVEMDVVIAQVRGIVDQVSMAVELVLLVILAAGALVLVAGVQASVDERMEENAILRALGARRSLLLGGLAIEFATLGLFAGLFAVAAAELSVYILQRWVMEMAYSPSYWIWLPGMLAGALLIGCLGLLSCRRVVATPPLRVLREL